MGSCLSRNVKTANESLISSYPAVHTPSKGSPEGSTEGMKEKPGKNHRVPSMPKINSKVSLIPENILGKPLRDIQLDYEIGKELGRGLFGVTRVAIEKSTGTKYACKTITKRRLTAANYGNLKREVDIMLHLGDSPYIAALKATYEDERFVHLVLELCSGGMLYDSITSQGTYSEQSAAQMVRKIMEVVQFLHGKGIIHRDLKLENFMFSKPGPEGQLKAIDFGLSTFFTEGETFNEICGSAYYVAPEVLKKSYGKECDVWSVGVILYMLLCGVPPFWDVSEAGICAAVLKGKYNMDTDPWPTITPCVKELVKRMLEVDPAKRITVEEVLAHGWIVKDGTASSAPLACPILDRVKKFIGMNKIKRKALAVIAKHCLDDSELKYIRAKYDYLNVSGTGHLTFEEMLNGIRNMNITVSEENILSMFEAADTDSSGTLEFSEYASAIMVQRMDDERIRKAFEFFDRDNKGFISVDDIRSHMSDGDVIEAIVNEVDTKQDGRIDFDEFRLMMESGMERRTVTGGPKLSVLTESRLQEYYKCKQ